jgi:diaminohydroxyphosphoribosylaminopyrimidine deaminase / 5-amino-6-(5-phosphoribosylamino)uracil reductase
MHRALRQAVRSLGRTWPNPGVGCVLVRDGRVIGEGRHERCGEPHAEINALADAGDARGATAYVTLAPCTRYGRTPPCAEALVQAGVVRVVAALPDPVQDDPRTVFQNKGIDYQVGVCWDEAEYLHGGFLRRISTGRPRVTAKWAMTLDGCLACAGGMSNWISSSEALALSRRRRRAFDGILVGAGTAAADDPHLLSSVSGRSPVRIVVGGAHTSRLASGRQLFETARQQPVWLLHPTTESEQSLVPLQAAGIQCFPLADPHQPEQVLRLLGQEGLNELLVEGGAQLHGAWLRAGVVDRIECYLAARTIGGGMPVAQGPGVLDMRQATDYRPEQAPRVLGSTVCWRLRRRMG